MKPGIVNIIYFVLALLFAGAAMQVINIFGQSISNGYSALYNSSISIVIAVATLVSIISLAKKIAWSRIVSFVTIGLQSLFTIGLGVFFAIQSNENSAASSIFYLAYGLPLLFLAYKIYSSEPLKEYLSNA